MGRVTSTATTTILNGQTVSAAIYVGDKPPVALQMPAGFTGTSMSFQGSPDGVTYQAINLGGAAYSETVAASKNIALEPGAFAGLPYLKLVSGSAEGADRVITVCTRAVGR